MSMNKYPTPLQVMYIVLTGGVSEPPDEHDKLREALRAVVETEREWEIFRYLDDAAARRLPRYMKKRGSLKHVLMFLRTGAGDLYLPIASAVVEYLLENEHVPLANILPYLGEIAGKIGRVVLNEIARPTDWRALETHLDEVRVGDLRVAVNTTHLNLTSVAMRLGYHVIVAYSERGVAIQVQECCAVDDSALPAGEGGGWVTPYPHLAMWKGRLKDAPCLKDVLGSLPRAVKCGCENA